MYILRKKSDGETNMKTLKTKDVCNWLVSLGILEEITKGNKKTKSF